MGKYWLRNGPLCGSGLIFSYLESLFMKFSPSVHEQNSVQFCETPFCARKARRNPLIFIFRLFLFNYLQKPPWTNTSTFNPKNKQKNSRLAPSPCS